jgi:nucleotide-binding universal stress UspA family protein
MRIETILAPTDFSETANHAVEQAMELSMRYGAALHLFHVVAAPEATSGGVTSALQDYLQKLVDDAQQSLALKIDVLRGNDIDVHYETSSADTPDEGIARKAERLEPDLIVMGTHGRTGLNRLLMGSVAEKVLRHVPHNFLALNKKAPLIRAAHAFERILVPVDFSEHSKRALELAVNLLVPSGELHVVHVVASPIHPSFYAGGVTQLFALDPELPKRIHDRIAEWLEGQPVTSIVVREGDIFAELEDVREGLDPQLVVMGTRGLSGLDHLLVGSVTEKMVRISEIPVLSVPCLVR